MNVVSKFSKRAGLAFALAVGAAAIGGPAVRAGTIDLINNTSGVTDQGTYFNQTSLQPTGSGVIDPFLTIKMKGSEQGYNTDATSGDLLNDLRESSSYVKAIKIDSIAGHAVKGLTGDYAEFFLDINEDNGKGEYLSLNKLQLFVTTDRKITGYTGPNQLTGASTDGFANASMIYDMDATTDYTVQMDYSLNHGSGSGDLHVYIPYSVFLNHLGPNNYLVLYSAFGNPYNASSGLYESSAGYEEWWVVNGDHPTPPVPGPGLPLPSTAASGAVVLGLLGIRRRSRK